MTYRRVLPRDLFNEANLLKCYAQLWLLLENSGSPVAGFDQEDVPEFKVEQDPADGSLSIVNLTLSISGRPWGLFRPLNSRRPWPLYARRLDEDDEPVAVFEGDGGNRLSAEFGRIIGSAA